MSNYTEQLEKYVILLEEQLKRSNKREDEWKELYNNK